MQLLHPNTSLAVCTVILRPCESIVFQVRRDGMKRAIRSMWGMNDVICLKYCFTLELMEKSMLTRVGSFIMKSETLLNRVSSTLDAIPSPPQT